MHNILSSDTRVMPAAVWSRFYYPYGLVPCRPGPRSFTTATAESNFESNFILSI